MRLLTATSIAALVVSVAALVLVLMLFVTEPWEPEESASTANPIVLTEPTPTPFGHKQLLSTRQVEGIMEKFGKSTKRPLGANCQFDYLRPGLNREVVWRYMDDNSDRWMVTATANGCGGIKTWFVDDNTGKANPGD